MKTFRDRAREAFPATLLTLISIIQGVALESMWSKITDSPEIHQLSLAAATAWLQAATTLGLLILTWLVYAGLIMRFQITPRTLDLIMPFAVGLIQFSLIDVMTLDTLGAWFLLLSLTLAMMATINHRLMRRAREDGANNELFDTVPRASRSDHIKTALRIALVIPVGAWFWYNPEINVMALVALVITFVMVIYRFKAATDFWNRSIFGDLDPPK